MIPIEKIEGIEQVYQVLNDHTEILAKISFVAFGNFQIFKKYGNTNQLLLEVGDGAAGFIDANMFMPFGFYLGGDPQDITSWDTSPMDVRPVGSGGPGNGPIGGEAFNN